MLGYLVRYLVKSYQMVYFKIVLLNLYFDFTFRFPLENKTMLKNWVNSIGLPNWQPTHADRICSNHFENDAVLKINNVYGLNNDAIPSIKLQVCV